MTLNQRLIHLPGLSVPCLQLSGHDYSIEVLPGQGLSLVSFKYRDRELLDQWDLGRFVGTPGDFETVARKVTQTFRKGFGPSIGPWFGGRFQGDTAWNHGVCRFADWSQGLDTGNDFIRSRLTGGQALLPGKSLDEICGFRLDVQITYSLSAQGLLYTVENFSEGRKGTYGIHWYFQNPAGTKALLAVSPQRVTGNGSKEPLDNKIFTLKGDRVEAATSFSGAYYLENRFPLAPDQSHASVSYPDGLKLDFSFSDSFRYTTLFCSDNFLCVEPISGLPNGVGTFDRGQIRIRPI